MGEREEETLEIPQEFCGHTLKQVYIYTHLVHNETSVYIITETVGVNTTILIG